jgi:hypothetical protein
MIISMKTLTDRFKSNKKKVAVGILLFVIVFAFWVELAVGIFNSPIAGS